MGIYERVATSLIASCRGYRARQLTLSELKARVWDAAQSIVAVEEKSVRVFLQRAEGRLDIVEHTTNEDEIFDASLVIVAQIERRLQSYLGGDGRNHVSSP